ncbi:MAG: hypothetical protein ACJ8JD_01205 [Chthoniobacterales bacterium]
MAGFIGELKRRKVYRVAVAYAVVGWLLVQVATQVFPFLDIPNWAVRLVIAVTVLGFPLALVVSWVFDLTPHGLERTAEAEPSPEKAQAVPRASIPEKSIAVLPFENLSDDRENSFFADGIHDDILTALAKIADLKVISRTSVQQYKDRTRNLREIGDALGVAHVLEGTVRRAGNRVRVNVQLLNARSDVHLWGDSFDREMTDLFAIQSELAEKISSALRANLSPREKARLQIRPTDDMRAYECYVQARHLFHWSGIGDAQESGERALPLLDEAIARDRRFALAYALASRFHAELYWFGSDKRPIRIDLARTAAERALEIQPGLGEAHVALGFYHYYAHRDYDRARAELMEARKTMPNSYEVLAALGMVDRREARWDSALANLERANEVNPRSMDALWNCIETYIFLRRYDEAHRAIETALSISPHAHFLVLAGASLQLRMRGDTAAVKHALDAIPGNFDPGGAVTTIAVRISLMQRNYDQAAKYLAASRRDSHNDNGLSGMAGALDDYAVPRAWYEGLIARGRGDEAGARQHFKSARETVEADAARFANDAKTLAMLGLVQAALGNRGEAIREAERAVELLPVERDAIDGALVETNAAVIYAQVGETDRAIAQLQRLIDLPGGPTPGLLSVEPEWEPLRDDPRFAVLATGGG